MASEWGSQQRATGLASLLKTGEYSDLTIRCGDREFKVHRSILCPQSPFFKAACDGSFQEAESKVVLLKEDDPEVVERMLQYLYNNDVGSYGDLSTTGRPFLRCAQLYAIGDKYDISGLKRFAMRRFKTFAEIKQKFGGDFVEAIKKIYNSTPEQDYGLRDVAAEVAQGKIHRLRNNEGFVAVLKEIPDFALGLLNAMIEEEEGQHCVCCKHNSPSEALYCMFCRASFAQMEESVRAILS